MSSQLIPPASELGYGYVVCRVIRRVADTVDEDDKPDILPASGKVIFTPAQELARTMDYSAFLLAERLELPLDSTGHLVRRTPEQGETLEPGVWLAAGVYSVVFRLDSGDVPAFTVEVTTDHTPEAPLDLVTAAPYTPPTGVTVQTILVPAGAVPGHVLAWTGDGARWQHPVDPELVDDAISPYVASARGYRDAAETSKVDAQIAKAAAVAARDETQALLGLTEGLEEALARILIGPLP